MSLDPLNQSSSADSLFPNLNNDRVEIQQEDPSENEAPTLGWSLRIFLGVCLFIDVCEIYIYRLHVYL